MNIHIDLWAIYVIMFFAIYGLIGVVDWLREARKHIQDASDWLWEKRYQHRQNYRRADLAATLSDKEDPDGWFRQVSEMAEETRREIASRPVHEPLRHQLVSATVIEQAPVTAAKVLNERSKIGVRHMRRRLLRNVLDGGLQGMRGIDERRLPVSDVPLDGDDLRGYRINPHLAEDVDVEVTGVLDLEAIDREWPASRVHVRNRLGLGEVPVGDDEADTAGYTAALERVHH